MTGLGTARATSVASEPVRTASAGSDAVIRARGVTVRFGDTLALDRVSLDVAPGEVVALLGHSGSGKSTFMRALTQLAPATADELTVAGRDVLQLKGGALQDLRADVGYVFQHFNLVPNISALTNVLTGGLHRAGLANTIGLFPSELRAEAVQPLRRVGLEYQAKQPARTLSGGQQQRVAIARALMQRPQLILADEPVASLDPRLAGSVLSLIRSVAEERGIPAVVSLHVVDLAKRYTDRIVGLHRGVVVFDAPVAELTDEAVAAIYAHDEEDEIDE